jgi:hypothetical protein
VPIKGQRFDKWNSLLFFHPDRMSEGNPYVPLRGEDGQIIEAEPIPIAIASSGSLNVRGRVPH